MRATVSDPAGPSRWRTATTLGPLAAAALALPFGLPVATSLAAVAIAWMFGASALRPPFRAREAEVVVERRAIRIAGAGPLSQRIRAADVAGAAIGTVDGGTVVALARGWTGDRPVILQLAHRQDAERLRRALGIGARGFGSVSWPCGRDVETLVLRLLSAIGWLGIAAAAAFGSVEVALGFLFPMLLLSVVTLAWLGSGDVPRAKLGPTSVAGRHASVQHAAIEEASADEHGLLLQTVDAHVRIAMPGSTREERAHAAALARSAARRARDEGPPRTRADLAPLARAPGEDSRRWLQRIDAMAASLGDSSGYRGTGVERDDLWEALEDPDAPPTLRAAAARLLARIAPDEAPRRIADALAVGRDGAARARIRIALEEDIETAARDLDRLAAR